MCSIAWLASTIGLCAQQPIVVEVEVDSAPRVFEHGVVDVTIRIAVERGFLAQGLVQLFARPVELPLQLVVPWWDGQAGIEPLEPTSADGDHGKLQREPNDVHIVLGDRLAFARRGADRQRHGVDCAVFELARRFVVMRAGPLRLVAPRLRYAFATRFVDDVISGRVPADRSEAWVEARPLELDVEVLPEVSRPPEFSGAVGRFAIDATVDHARLTVGEHFTLTIRITGDGDLTRFAAPRLDRLQGFEAFGSATEINGRARVIRYDLAARAIDVVQIPAVEFWFFDDRALPPGYRRVSTEPIAVTIAARPDAGAPELVADAPLVPGVDDVHDIVTVDRLHATDPAVAGSRSPIVRAVWLGLPWCMVASAGLLGWALRRRRPTPATVRARAALTRFERASANSADPFAEFVEFLAARLGCSAQAIIAPDLAERLTLAGARPESIVDCVAAIGQADVARYADPTSSPRRSTADLTALARRFDRELTWP